MQTVSSRWAETVTILPFSEPPVLGAVPGTETPPSMSAEWMVLRKQEGGVKQGPGIGQYKPAPSVLSATLVPSLFKIKIQGRQVLVFLLYRRRGGSLERLSTSQWRPANDCGIRRLDRVCLTCFLPVPSSVFQSGVYQPWVCISFRMMTLK